MQEIIEFGKSLNPSVIQTMLEDEGLVQDESVDLYIGYTIFELN